MSEQKQQSALDSLRQQLLGERQLCTNDEMDQFDAMRKKNEPLPSDIVYEPSSNTYYRILTPAFQSEDEEARFFRYRMYQQIRSIDRHTDSIRRMMIFFVVLTVIGLAAAVLLPILGVIALR